jgi:hypothetical protein
LIAAFIVAASPSFAQDVDDSASTTSPGGQKIIGALYEGQVVPAGETELSKADIADMKAGTGWGKLFQQLKLQGRYPEYRNLGQLISSGNRLERASHARSNNLQRTSRHRTGQPPDAPRPTEPTGQAEPTLG